MTDRDGTALKARPRGVLRWGIPCGLVAVGFVMALVRPNFLWGEGVALVGAFVGFATLGWKRGVGLLLVWYAASIFGVIPYLMGGFATLRRFHYNDKENAGLTPASYQLPFDDVQFKTPDGLLLKGWWVKAPENRGTVILVHGLNRSRIEMIRKVPFVHGLGWNTLLFDLRCHGESGCTTTTFGYREKDDVRAAVAFAREQAQGPVALWGVSLGAASVMLEAAEDPSIGGMICDSSYLSLKDTVPHHLALFRRFAPWLRIVPVWPVADETLFWIGERGGFPTSAIDIQAASTKVAGRPVLYVACSGDPRMPKEIAFKLQAAAGKTAQVLVVPGESHGGAYRDGTAAYQAAVTQILGEVKGGTPGTQTQVSPRADP
jgi:pimeloyl-ACP methyl ester carboxylesterase